MDFLRDLLCRGPHVSLDITTCNINEHITHELGILFPNRWRSGSIADVCQQGNRHLSTARRRHKNTFETIKISSEIAGIAHTERIAFTTFDGHCDRVPSDRTLNDLIHILYLKAVPSRRISVHTEIQEITPRGSLGKSASGVRKIGEHLFDLNRNIFDSLKIGAEDLDAQHCAGSGRQHLSAGLDRHPEDLSHARGLASLI